MGKNRRKDVRDRLRNKKATPKKRRKKRKKKTRKQKRAKTAEEKTLSDITPGMQHDNWGTEMLEVLCDGDIPDWFDKFDTQDPVELIEAGEMFRNPSDNIRVVLKPELYQAFDRDRIAALLINQLMYWTPRTGHAAQFLREETIRLAHYTSWKQMPESKRQHEDVFFEENNALRTQYGWIKKSFSDLAEEVMVSHGSVENKMNMFKEIGLIECRKPRDGWGPDKYRINFPKLAQLLEDAGHSIHDVTPMFRAYFCSVGHSEDEQNWWADKIDGQPEDFMPDKGQHFDFISSILKSGVSFYDDESIDGQESALELNDTFRETKGAILNEVSDVPYHTRKPFMYGVDHVKCFEESMPDHMSLEDIRDLSIERQSLDVQNEVETQQNGGVATAVKTEAQTQTQISVHNTSYIETITKTNLLSSLRELLSTTRGHAGSREKSGKMKRQGKGEGETDQKKSKKTKTNQSEQIQTDSESGPTRAFPKNSKKSFSAEQIEALENEYAVGEDVSTVGARFRTDAGTDVMNESGFLKGREGKVIQAAKQSDEADGEYTEPLSDVADRYDPGVRDIEDREHGPVGKLNRTFHDSYLLLNEVFDEVDVTPDSLKTLFAKLNSDRAIFREMYSKLVFGDKLVPSGTVYDLVDRVDSMIDELESKTADESLDARRQFERKFSVSLGRDAGELDLSTKEKKLYRYLNIIKKLFEGEDIIETLHERYRQNIPTEHAVELKCPDRHPSDVRCRIVYIMAELGIEEAYSYLQHLAEGYAQDRGFMNSWRWTSVPDVFALLCSGAVESYILRETNINCTERKRLDRQSQSNRQAEYDPDETGAEQSMMTAEKLSRGEDWENSWT